MPEGDTIFRAARTLHRALAGHPVVHFESGYAQLARMDPPLEGRTIEKVEAAGKHSLIHFSGDLVLRTHMRMNGSWHLYRPGEAWRHSRSRARIVIETDTFVAVGFDIPVAEFHTEGTLTRQEDLRKMGPDLLAEDFDPGEMFRRMRERPDQPLHEVLLNQRVAAGIGNVFKCEILFVCGVSPFAQVRALSDETLRELIAQSRKLLKANVTEGKADGIVTYFGYRRTTGRTNPEERLWVYSRGGQPCRRCATPISFAQPGLNARVTYWCPSCQRVGAE